MKTPPSEKSELARQTGALLVDLAFEIKRVGYEIEAQYFSQVAGPLASMTAELIQLGAAMEAQGVMPEQIRIERRRQTDPSAAAVAPATNVISIASWRAGQIGGHRSRPTGPQQP